MLFRKCGCLVVHGKWIFQKRISIDRKIKAFDSENIFSQNFTFKSFPETCKERKRGRKKGLTRSNRERERERERERLRTQKNPRSSHHRQDRQTQDRRTQKTQDRCTANPRTASRTANPLPISFSFSFEIFVLKFVCDFDFLLSLFDL